MGNVGAMIDAHNNKLLDKELDKIDLAEKEEEKAIDDLESELNFISDDVRLDLVDIIKGKLSSSQAELFDDKYIVSFDWRRVGE